MAVLGVEDEAGFKSAGEAHHESIKMGTWSWIPQQLINEELAEAELKEHQQSL